MPCFLLPSVCLPTEAKDGGEEERLCLPGKYSPAGRSNFRFTRPGTLAVSFHVADSAVLAQSNRYVRNAAGKSNLAGWGVVNIGHGYQGSRTTDPFWLTPSCLHLGG